MWNWACSTVTNWLPVDHSRHYFILFGEHMRLCTHFPNKSSLFFLLSSLLIDSMDIQVNSLARVQWWWPRGQVASFLFDNEIARSPRTWAWTLSRWRQAWSITVLFYGRDTMCISEGAVLLFDSNGFLQLIFKEFAFRYFIWLFTFGSRESEIISIAFCILCE